MELSTLMAAQLPFYVWEIISLSRRIIIIKFLYFYTDTASGIGVDWAKGALNIPLTYTYEFRDKGTYGFVLPASQIVPNAQEVLDSLITLVSEARTLGYF